jgi:DNA-binding GntR family transcriptional regulator
MLAGDPGQVELWKRYDWEFHKAMIQACNSDNLLSLHAIIYSKYLRYQILVLTSRGEEAVAEHRAMFDAALARDVNGAIAALKTHILKGLEHSRTAMS